MVECFLAKEDVAGSTPVSRSKKSLPRYTSPTIQPGYNLDSPPRGAVPKW